MVCIVYMLYSTIRERCAFCYSLRISDPTQHTPNPSNSIPFHSIHLQSAQFCPNTINLRQFHPLNFNSVAFHSSAAHPTNLRLQRLQIQVLLWFKELEHPIYIHRPVRHVARRHEYEQLRTCALTSCHKVDQQVLRQPMLMRSCG